MSMSRWPLFTVGSLNLISILVIEIYFVSSGEFFCGTMIHMKSTDWLSFEAIYRSRSHKNYLLDFLKSLNWFRFGQEFICLKGPVQDL